MESSPETQASESRKVEPEKILGLDDGQPSGELLKSGRRGRQADTRGATNLLSTLLGQRRSTS